MDATKLDARIYMHMLIEYLMDVPCSGLGIIRKKPEIKWNKTRKSIKRFSTNSKRNNGKCLEICKKWWNTMIYSTCTLNKEENEENIEWFLKNIKILRLEQIF